MNDSLHLRLFLIFAKMRIKILYILLFQALFFVASAQKTRLDSYIKEAIGNSHQLKQENFNLEKNMLALEEAKALKSFNVNFSGLYTIGAGGRSIEFPLGDLFNPIYEQLYGLTKNPAWNIQQENRKFTLNPYNFYDLKVRTTYPLINSEIKINERAKAEMIPFKQAEINVFKRELAKDIKVAYFRFLQSNQAISIFENAQKLLNEVKRVNQSLINNGVGLPSLLVKSNSELAKIEAQKIEAQNNKKNAAAYFNYLLGKKLDSEIEIDTMYLAVNQRFTKEIKADISNREELLKLQSAARLTEVAKDFQKVFFKPKLNTFVDLGAQGYVYPFNSNPLYVLGGLQFEVPLYDAKKNNKRIQMAEKDVAALKEQTENIEEQLQLQLQIGVNSYLSALSIFESTNAQVILNRRYYSDLMKKYKEGTSLMIELNDAQTQLLISELQQSISLSNVWMKLTELERVSAAYQF
jgi:outer membrane protein